MRTTGKVAGNRLERASREPRPEAGRFSRLAGGGWRARGAGIVAPLPADETGRAPHDPAPVFDNQPCTTELTAQKEEQVDLLSGSCRLLRIDGVDRATDAQGRKTEIKGVYWADAAGLVLKSRIEAMNIDPIASPRRSRWPRRSASSTLARPRW